jgi:hypothetical protein
MAHVKGKQRNSNYNTNITLAYLKWKWKCKWSSINSVHWRPRDIEDLFLVSVGIFYVFILRNSTKVENIVASADNMQQDPVNLLKEYEA